MIVSGDPHQYILSGDTAVPHKYGGYETKAYATECSSTSENQDQAVAVFSVRCPRCAIFRSGVTVMRVWVRTAGVNTVMWPPPACSVQRRAFLSLILFNQPCTAWTVEIHYNLSLHRKRQKSFSFSCLPLKGPPVGLPYHTSRQMKLNQFF